MPSGLDLVLWKMLLVQRKTLKFYVTVACSFDWDLWGLLLFKPSFRVHVKYGCGSNGVMHLHNGKLLSLLYYWQWDHILPLQDHHFYQFQLFSCLHAYYHMDVESVDFLLLWTLLGNWSLVTVCLLQWLTRSLLGNYTLCHTVR